VLQTSKLITTTPFVLLGERSSPSTGAPIVAAALALPALSLVPCRGPADPARDAGAVAAAATADAVGAAAGGQRVDTTGTGAVSARAGAAFAATPAPAAQPEPLPPPRPRNAAPPQAAYPLAPLCASGGEVAAMLCPQLAPIFGP
jgi:hypothetical protein